MGNRVVNGGTKGDPFTLVVINFEGDGYYQVDSRDLGPVRRPLEPDMQALKESGLPTSHTPYTRGPGSALVATDLPPSIDDDDGVPEFCGTYCFNLHAFNTQPNRK